MSKVIHRRALAAQDRNGHCTELLAKSLLLEYRKLDTLSMVLISSTGGVRREARSCLPILQCTPSIHDSIDRHNAAVRLTFRDASLDDVPAIAALHNAAAGALTAGFGEGHWSHLVTERGTASTLRHARVRIGREGRRIVTVLRLATKKPWAIDVSYFTPVKKPLYLTGMSVSVAHQGKGLGRLALDDAITVARKWPADAIRLDSYDAAAGAGQFYAACGFHERGRVRYKGNPLVYYELLLK